MKIYAKHYLNGEWVESTSGQMDVRENPARIDEIVGQVRWAGNAEMKEAVQSARRALPGWKSLSGGARSEILHRAANLIEQHIEELAQLMTSEMGKPIGEARGEVKRAVVLLRYNAGEGLRAMGEVYPASDGKSLLYSNLVPLGVVGVITPWNFPVAIPIWKMAPALIFGNTVVWKPAETAVITAYRLMQLLEQAGFPKGVINMVLGKGSEVGSTLLTDPDVDAISFTGSNAVGRKIAVTAAERGAKYQLEMGGKNPTVIASDADLNKAVNTTVSAAMRFAGQKCTATSRVIIEESVMPTFMEMLLEKVANIKLSNPLENDCYLGPVAHKGQFDSVRAAIENGLKNGARMLTGGQSLQGELAKGYYIAPTVFDQVDPKSDLAQHEIFGPVLSVIPAADLSHALELANDSRFGLSAAIFTKDIDRMMRFMKTMDAGLIKINGETSGVEPHAPFGGMKQSSSHSREQGRAAIEFFTSIQTIWISSATE